MNFARPSRTIALDSPQIAEGVSQKLDLWIKGGFQKIERIQLSANVVSQGIQEPAITVSETVDEAGQGVESRIIALQNQLAEEILAGLGISVTPALQVVIQNTPTNNGEALALNNTAAFMLQQDIELEAVRAMLQQAIDLDPNYASPYNNLGRLFVKRNELDRAITEYQRAIALSPNNPLYHFNLGAAYERKGDLTASVQAYQAAIKLDPAYNTLIKN